MVVPMSFRTALMTLILTTVGLAACAGQVPVASGKDPTNVDGQRSSKSSGIAYREAPVQIAEIGPPRVSFAGDPRLGNAAAKIGIVEFSDFQCPYCRDFHRQLLPQLKEKYIDVGIAQFIFKDFPLRMHSQALPAAMAANCAGQQGSYWEMHDALFANQGRLGAALFPELARGLRLDEAKFSACLNDPVRQEKILQSIAEARRLGLTGTPSFLIGRIEGNVLIVARIARGMPSLEALVEEIEKLRGAEAGATPSTK